MEYYSKQRMVPILSIKEFQNVTANLSQNSEATLIEKAPPGVSKEIAKLLLKKNKLVNLKLQYCSFEKLAGPE